MQIRTLRSILPYMSREQEVHNIDYIAEQTHLAAKDVMSVDEVKKLEDIQNIGPILAKSGKHSEKQPTPVLIMSREEVAKALNRKLEGDMEGTTRHVYFDKDDTSVAVKVGKSGINLEEQAEEQRKEQAIHSVLHRLFPYNIPEILETKLLETKDGKKALVMIMQRIQEGANTEILHPLSKAEDICKNEFGFPRFRDSNDGNTMIDSSTGGEYNTDDLLITPQDLINAKPKIFAYINRKDNPGGYSREDKQEIKERFGSLEEKYGAKQPQRMAA